MSNSQSSQTTAVLYHFDFSICSIMVRYAIALCCESKINPITISEQRVDILHKEHFTEEFLCNINPKGEVPVLVPAGARPIPDSVEITKYLASFYPSLVPASHEREIKDLLAKLHEISFFSLTFAGHPEGQKNNKAYLEELLSGQISEDYRKALENRVNIIDEHLDVLEPDQSQRNEEYAKSLMQELDDLLNTSQTGWLLGLDNPSALDAHLVCFIARMTDRKRGDLIPERLQSYGLRAMNGEEWKSVMQGQSTLPLKI